MNLAQVEGVVVDLTKLIEVYGPLGLFAAIAIWLITKTIPAMLEKFALIITKTIPAMLEKHEETQKETREEFQRELKEEREHREAMAESQLQTFKSMADTCHEQQRENAEVTAQLRETISRIPCNGIPGIQS